MTTPAATSRPASAASTLTWIMLGAAAVLLAVLAGLHVNRFLTRGDVGDYQYYYLAAKAAIEGRDIYRQPPNYYGYLPMFAIMQSVLVPLGVGGAGAAWVVCNLAFTYLVLWIGGRDILRRLGLKVDLAALAPVVLIAVLVMSDKIRSQYRLGQSDAVILLAFVLALRYLGERPWVSGWSLGFIANFKYQSIPFIPYLLVRRRYAAAAWTAISAVALALSGTLLWGWARNTEYLGTALGSVRKMLSSKTQLIEGPALFPLDWHRSVSIPSTLARLAERLGIEQRPFVAVGTALFAAAAFGLGWWLYVRYGRSLFVGRTPEVDDTTTAGRTLTLLEWCGLITAALAFSPQTTARHFFLMLFPVMVAAALAVHGKDRVARAALLIALVVFWLGLILPFGAGDEQRNPWRLIGGPMWCALGLYFTTLWAGLRHLQRLDREPAP